MQTPFELNPFDNNKNFQEAMRLLVSSYTKPTTFSTSLRFENNTKTFTLSHAGIITTKRKHDALDETKKPRYVAFYHDKSIGNGSFGTVYVASIVFKYDSAEACQAPDTIKPLKIKHPNNLLIKLSKLQDSFDYNYFLKEQTHGHHFIKMSYTVTATTYQFMLLMEKVPGIPLFDFIGLLNKNPSMITAKSYLQIVLNLLKKLKEIHFKDIIHCDIKPENILIDKYFNIRFVDFGGSRKTCDTYNNVFGTRVYLPPLDFQCNTQKSDIFSLCLVILELLGQTNRNYLRTIDELNNDNYNISVNEILLGTDGFSLDEIKTLKETLKRALQYKSQNRLDDLNTLISAFKNLFDHHTQSDVKPFYPLYQMQVQDIITYQQKGAPILLADIEEWFSTKKRSVLKKETWCSVALYLYSQLKEEADAYFLTANIDDPFIQTFITHQLPRHHHWQDTTVTDFCENMLQINNARQDIERFIHNEVFNSTQFVAYLARIIKEENSLDVIIDIAQTCKHAASLYSGLSLIKDDIDDIDDLALRELIELSQKNFVSAFNVSTYATRLISAVYELRRKNVSYQVFQHYLKNIVRLKVSSPSCYQTLNLTIQSSLKNFMTGKSQNCDLDEKTKNFLKIIIAIENSFLILEDLKNHYSLSHVIYNTYLSLLNNALTNITLENHDTQIKPIQSILSQLPALSKNTLILIRLKSEKSHIAPAFVDWVNTQLPLLFANDNNITDFNNTTAQLNLFAECAMSYFYDGAFKYDPDKKAWQMFIQLTQFIFKLSSLKMISHSLDNICRNKSHLCGKALALMKLEKTLYYAGYWEIIRDSFVSTLKIYFCSRQSLLATEILIGQTIIALFDQRDMFSSDAQQLIYKALINHMISSKCIIDERLYVQLQRKVDSISVIKAKPSWLDSVITLCESGKIQDAINYLSGLNLTLVSQLNMFKIPPPSVSDRLDYATPAC